MKELLKPIDVAGAKPREREYMLNDGDGLLLRVQPNGRRTWILYAGSGAARRKLTLGRAEDHTIKAARVWASAQRALVDAGRDPNAEKSARRAGVETLGRLLEAYIADRTEAGVTSVDDARGLFAKIPQTLSDKLAADVTSAELVAVLKTVIDTGAGRQAAKLRTYLRAAFARAIRADVGLDPTTHASLRGFGLRFNPAADIDALSQFSVAGDRALSRAEMVEFWRRLKALPSQPDRDLLWLAVRLGGQRLQPLARATLGADPEGLPTIVADDRKGRRKTPRVHVTPLDAESVAFLKARGGAWALPPATARTRANYAARVCAQISADMLADGKASAPFQASDLRRSAETLLQSLGSVEEVRNHLQSHGLGGVVKRHYSRFEFLAEKRAMLAKWVALLEGRKAPTNVVPLKRRRA